MCCFELFLFYVLFLSIVSFYVLFVNVYCTTATGCLPNCSEHISYHIISYHIISYHIIYHISYHIISYHIISYHIISYHIISYHIISYHIISYISYHIISYIAYHNFKLEKLNGRGGFGELILCRRIILKWILKQQDLKLAHNIAQGRAFVHRKFISESHKKRVTF